MLPKCCGESRSRATGWPDIGRTRRHAGAPCGGCSAPSARSLARGELSGRRNVRGRRRDEEPAWPQQKVVLIEPAAYMRLGKLVQLDLAKVYFHVPKYEFVMGADRQFYSDSKRIVKSLTSMPLAKNVFLWTTPVRPAELHRGTPWLLQDLVDARFDVTVVYVRGGIFAFELDRTAFTDKSVDWREVGELATPLWRPHRFPEDMCARVENLMTDANLHYGRLDFLYDGSTYAFLEVNSNGEWEWLDRTDPMACCRGSCPKSIPTLRSIRSRSQPPKINCHRRSTSHS